MTTMRWIVAGCATALVLGLPAGAQDVPAKRADEAQPTVGALIARAAKAAGVTAVYDSSFDKQTISLTTGGPDPDARAVAELALEMRGYRLEEAGKGVWRVVQDRARISRETSVVLDVKHAPAHALAAILNSLGPKEGEWVRASSGPTARTLVVVGRADPMALAQSIVERLDRPTSDVVAPLDAPPALAVVRLRFVRAAEAQQALALLQVKFAIQVTSNSVVLTGRTADVDRAKALLADLDVEAPAPPGGGK